MMQAVYSILDRKAQTFGNLIIFQNDDIAKRGCADLMRAGGDYPMTNYPDDFDLYRVGSFETDTGVVEGSTPILVIRFGDFVKGQ